MKLTITLAASLFIVTTYAAFLSGFVYARYHQTQALATYLEP